MMAPASASSAPTVMATAMRGSRIEKSTSWSRASKAGSSPEPTRAANSRPSGMPAAPTMADMIATDTSNNVSSVNTSSGAGRRRTDRT